jgi:AcrR family transcriptional regulator
MLRAASGLLTVIPMPTGNRTAAHDVTRAERRKRETREKLLDAALRLFLKGGYSTVSTADIAAAADVGAGTFYLHFEDKPAILRALGERAVTEIIGRWRSKLSSSMTPAQIVTALLRSGVEFWRKQPGRARLLLEGGPPIKAETLVKLAQEVAAELSTAIVDSRIRIEAVANLLVAMAFQLGRVVVALNGPDAQRIIKGSYELIERALSRGSL